MLDMAAKERMVGVEPIRRHMKALVASTRPQRLSLVGLRRLRVLDEGKPPFDVSKGSGFGIMSYAVELLQIGWNGRWTLEVAMVDNSVRSGMLGVAVL